MSRRRAPRILAVDPGGTTGYAVLHGRSVLELGAVAWAEAVGRLLGLFREYRPHLVVLEGWENQGRRPNINAAYANQVLGNVQALAAAFDVPLIEAFASRWKPAMRAGASLIRRDAYGVPKVRREDQAVANRVALELEGWPAEAFSALPRRDWPHAIDALGLAIWGWLREQPSARA